jgi:hypothetical protein
MAGEGRGRVATNQDLRVGAFSEQFEFRLSPRFGASLPSAKARRENAGDTSSTLVLGVSDLHGRSMLRSAPLFRRSLIDHGPRGYRVAAPVGLLTWAMRL